MAELSPAVRAFLAEPRFCVFATIAPDGMPHLTVVWYELQGDEIMMNIGRKRAKFAYLRRDPRGSCCIEDGARYVTISGPCTLQWADQEAAQADIKRLATRYDGPERAEEEAESQFRHEERVTIRLRIARVDARGFDD